MQFWPGILGQKNKHTPSPAVNYWSIYAVGNTIMHAMQLVIMMLLIYTGNNTIILLLVSVVASC